MIGLVIAVAVLVCIVAALLPSTKRVDPMALDIRVRETMPGHFQFELDRTPFAEIVCFANHSGSTISVALNAPGCVWRASIDPKTGDIEPDQGGHL
jgi:hypothetical protein